MGWIETTTPKTFTLQTEPPYLEIDFWQRGDDLYKCTQARTADEAFNESDWIPATPAEQAKSDAQSAKTDASEAKADASDAKADAQAASTTASEAKEIAEKTANHVFVDGEGLHVSSQEGDASRGWNTLLSSQGMAVRDGQDPELEIGSHETSVQKWSHLNAKSPLWISSESGSVSITGVDDQGNPTEMGIGIVEGENGEIDAIVQGHSIYIGNGDGKFGKLADWETSRYTQGHWDVKKHASGDTECETTLSFKGSFVNQLSPIFWTDAISLDFPAGLFSAAPRIQLTAEGGGVLGGASVNAKTKDSFTFYFYRFGSSVASNVRVNIRATS